MELNGEKTDTLIRGLVCGRAARVLAIDGGRICEKARITHGLSRVCTAALGRALMATAMMSAQQKDELDRITLIIKGGGPAGNIVCCGSGSAVKGYIEDPALELPLNAAGKLDVAGAVGVGELTVVRDTHMKEPYIGRCAMISGEIALDVAQYYTVSEQQPSIVYLGVRVKPDTGCVLSAGGIVVQPLPDCPDDVLDELTAAAEGIKAFSGMLEWMSAEQALSKLLPGFEPTGRADVRFECDCSRQRLTGVLVSMGEDELTDMIQKDSGAQLTCQFCNKVYDFSAEELTIILEEAKKRDEKDR